MSQHDMIIDNAAGASVRADINLALAALATNSSGPAEPGGKYPFMLWADTSNDMMKQRNTTNTAWIDLFKLSTGLPSILALGTVLNGIAAGTTQTSFKGKFINGCFRTNSGGYVSGTALPASVPSTRVGYGHDGWRAGAAGCTYTFTQTNALTPVTITSGTLISEAAADEIDSGTMILHWEGTAQARVGVNGASPSGAYASSPILFSCTPGQKVSAEFGTGTLGKVQPENGSVETSIEYPDGANQQLRCQRRYQKFTAVMPSGYNAVGSASYLDFPLKATMRTSPTGVNLSNVAYVNASGLSVNLMNRDHIRFVYTNTAGGHAYCTFDFEVFSEVL